MHPTRFPLAPLLALILIAALPGAAATPVYINTSGQRVDLVSGPMVNGACGQAAETGVTGEDRPQRCVGSVIADEAADAPVRDMVAEDGDVQRCVEIERREVGLEVA